MELCGCVCMCVSVHIIHRSVYGTFSFMWRILHLLFLAWESVICPIGAVIVNMCSFCIYFYVLLILFIYLFIFGGCHHKCDECARSTCQVLPIHTSTCDFGITSKSQWHGNVDPMTLSHSRFSCPLFAVGVDYDVSWCVNQTFLV